MEQLNKITNISQNNSNYNNNNNNIINKTITITIQNKTFMKMMTMDMIVYNQRIIISLHFNKIQLNQIFKIKINLNSNKNH